MDSGNQPLPLHGRALEGERLRGEGRGDRGKEEGRKIREKREGEEKEEREIEREREESERWQLCAIVRWIIVVVVRGGGLGDGWFSSGSAIWALIALSTC